ncbi:nucleoside/nucleotide kinase family protein [Phyllobacteriaceae bacterium JZ32]
METISRETLPSAILSRLKEGERLLVAIAGPPGAGKSTLSQQLRDALNKGGDGPSAIVPMDGFHLDNAILDQRNLRSRKGSPPTFDCAGFEMLLKRLRVADEDIVIPVFDRTLDLSRAGASMVLAKHRILIVEGNYLLLDEAPWSRLHPLFDLTIFLDVPFDELERRLIQRWLDHDHTPEEARNRALSNDIPNAQLVVSSSRPADYVVRD